MFVVNVRERVFLAYTGVYRNYALKMKASLLQRKYPVLQPTRTQSHFLYRLISKRGKRFLPTTFMVPVGIS